MGRGGKSKFRGSKGRPFNKNYKRSKNNGYLKHGVKKKNESSSKFVKNLKHIQRSLESEDTLKRQTQVEKNYSFVDQCSDSESEQDNLNAFEKLITSLQSTKRKNNQDRDRLNAIDSSEDSQINSDSEIDDSNFDANEVEFNEETTQPNEQSIDGLKSVTKNKSNSITGISETNGKKIKTNISQADITDSDESISLPQETHGVYLSDKEKNVEDQTIESEEEIEYLESEIRNSMNDPYSQHLDYDLSQDLLESVSKMNIKKEKLNWPKLGHLLVEIPTSFNVVPEESKRILNSLDDKEMSAKEGTEPVKIDFKSLNLNTLHIKMQLHPYILEANSENLRSQNFRKPFTELQAELLSIINNYQDLYLPQRNYSNGEEIRFIYCLHIMNHVLKARTRVIHHNAKLSKKCVEEQLTLMPDYCRDQGLVRPKVLIIVPFKNAAYITINLLIALLVPDLSGKVMNHKRFVDEFTGDELHFPVKNPKPEDYERTFAGNTDDCFRIGISITKKCLKLYSEFYSSDIIIASPLGLRMIIGAPGDENRDYDFLTSIEILILDQMDVILAQNWDHLLHVFDNLHLKPQSVDNTDFSRVRSWCLNGWSQFYRQSLLFSNHDLPEFRSIFNNHCRNYRGKIRSINPIILGTIRHVAIQIPQIFSRINVSTLETSFDIRFTYFINTILPKFRSSSMAHCLIYVPSYFDFVRIRNHFKKEDINFVQICEYTKEGKMARARDMFFHSSAHFMLYSERAHFFQRTRIKGIRHIIMYQPPTWPHFYPEMINLMQDFYQNPRDGLESNMTVTLLYTKYDVMRISSIIGTKKAASIVNSDKNTHMFMTE